MQKTHFTDEQIIMALHMAEQTNVDDVIRKLGISQATFYRWKTRFGGLLPAEVKRLRQLEEENKKLKSLVVALSLDKKMLQDVLSKKVKACSEDCTHSNYDSVLRGKYTQSLPNILFD